MAKPGSYFVVEASHIEALVDEVNTLLDAGWELRGELVICTTSPSVELPNEDWYYQAMVKESAGADALSDLEDANG